jgi:amidase
VSAALGSDGAGSVRIPAACCGLFGLKPQRGRVPTAPDVNPFQGMTVFGPLARHVEDAALLMRVIADDFPALPEARPLRIAVSVGLPPIGVKPDAEQLAAVENVSAALRDAGHTVFERELDYGMTMGNRVIARFLRGTGEKAIEVGHPERLSRRVRGLTRIGRSIPRPVAAAAAKTAAADMLRLGKIFDDADLVLTPMFTRRPPRVRQWDWMPAPVTLASMIRFTPYPGTFNHTGQPALAVPAGFAADGFPLGVQLVGPADSEPLLLTAGASLQQVRDWHTKVPAL